MGKYVKPKDVPAPPQISQEERDYINQAGVSLGEASDILGQERSVLEQNRDALAGLSGLVNEDGSINQAAVDDLRNRILAQQAQDEALGQTALDQLGTTFDRSPLQILSDDIALGEAQRLRDIQNGNYQTSTGALQAEQDEFDRLKASAARRGIKIEGDDLFSATSQSTAGNQLLADLRRNSEIRRDDERRFELARLSGQNLNRLGLASGEQAQRFNQAQALRTQPGQAQLGLFTGAQQFSPAQLAPSYMGISQSQLGLAAPFQQQRYLNYQRNVQNAANQQGFTNSLFGLGGTIAGAAIGGPVGGYIGGQFGRNMFGSPQYVTPGYSPGQGLA